MFGQTINVHNPQICDFNTLIFHVTHHTINSLIFSSRHIDSKVILLYNTFDMISTAMLRCLYTMLRFLKVQRHAASYWHIKQQNQLARM